MLTEKNDLYLAAQLRFFWWRVVAFLTISFIFFWSNYVMKPTDKIILKTDYSKCDPQLPGCGKRTPGKNAESQAPSQAY
jgi:hypothetical protein